MVAILVLGTADWDQPIATNQQYVVREIAKEHPVEFVESMGLRTPKLSMRDLKRIARRFWPGRRESSTARPVPANVRIVSPRVIPKHTGISRWVNRPLVARAVADWITADGQRILWTYTPVTYDLERHADRVVYHCVDLLAAVEGISAKLIQDSEATLSSGDVTCIGTSQVVVAHLESVGFSSVMHWPNVADTVEIAENRASAANREPRAVFAGNLSTQKVDFDVIAALVEAGIQVDLAGTISEADRNASDRVRDLERAGATYHGMLDLRSLAELYWGATVGLIPYALNDYTKGVSPLKTYEYLAAGLAVVSTGIPSVGAIERHVEVCDDSKGFAAAVWSHLGIPTVETIEHRIRLANVHSWTDRGAQVRRLISELTTGITNDG